jgi:hypothetical protein
MWRQQLPPALRVGILALMAIGIESAAARGAVPDVAEIQVRPDPTNSPCSASAADLRAQGPSSVWCGADVRVTPEHLSLHGRAGAVFKGTAITANSIVFDRARRTLRIVGDVGVIDSQGNVTHAERLDAAPELIHQFEADFAAQLRE